ncbi:ComEA family DNA-binding protein [Colwellia sp. Bg11-28]|uniref:ComEA family DNA-binding protein n=1 Tax=Colwellia sp. Bg11-28 TaxID=2058305 RepID=UPI000C320BBF|nr:helix-hairpin-helix domain-containing protein [Colwellia sp. Bg11-28]PKH87954.1 competence protein ComE [Colwellia sp. Bg11-28]
MNIQPKYLNKTLSVLTLGIILLVNSSLGLAKETNVTQAAQGQSAQSVKSQVVNLNKSTFEQLVTLKGVGNTKAQAIIVYRQQVGAFKSVNELTKVSGIGEKIVSDNKARLSI